MSMPTEFKQRLFPMLPDIIGYFGTPFHIIDEQGILDGATALKAAFGDIEGFNNFFAVKALRNPFILALMKEIGFGFDCSSENELDLARAAGALADLIMFTSNNTSLREFEVAAAHGGCILNLDDVCLIPKVPAPYGELACFRYNPGPLRDLTSVIGKPEECKYGITDAQTIGAYRRARELGAQRFGLHTMVISNELNYQCMVDTVQMLLNVCKIITEELGIKFEFINMGGGLGIPYRPKDAPIDIVAMGQGVGVALQEFKHHNGYQPKLFMESGRWITGPHGVLVTTCISRMSKYREFRGVDTACTASVMRPAMYHPDGGYHEILVPGKSAADGIERVSVVGPVCEDIDRFCWERDLPRIDEGDTVVIADTGAHAPEMSMRYNSRYAPQMLMLGRDSVVKMIARAETKQDHNAVFAFEPKTLEL